MTERETVPGVFHRFLGVGVLRGWVRPVDESLPREAEHRLWQMLRKKRMNGSRFVREYQLNPGCVLHYYCDGARIAIEVDYSNHDIRRIEESQRRAYIESCGITLLRIPERVLLANPESVRNTILDTLDGSRVDAA